MRKPIWRSFSLFLFLTLLLQAGCAPTPGSGSGLPGGQNPIQQDLTATTLTPATSTPLPTFTPILALPTITPTPGIATTTPSTPTVDQQAVILAQQLAPQFTQIFGVHFNPLLAKGLDAAKLEVPEIPPTGRLVAMTAPVIDENQRYTDRYFQIREVEGILSLLDSRLDLEAMNVINKGAVQPFSLPLGAYMIACHPERIDDCLAVSLQGEEFQVKPETVLIITITPTPTGTPTLTGMPSPTGTPTLIPTPTSTGTPCPIFSPCPTETPPPLPTSTVTAVLTQIAVATQTIIPTQTVIPTLVAPSVGFEDGSIRTCFWVLRRKICIKVF
jgi:hypothetical protein